MNEISVVFPYLIIERPCHIWGVKLESNLEKNVVIRFNYSNYEEEKVIDRKLKVIRSHLMLACYLINKDPLIYCKMMKLEENSFKNYSNSSLSVEKLLKILPMDLEKSALTVYWFSRYLEAKDEKNQIISLYNALGTLPSGYNKISSLSSSPDDKVVLEALISRIEDFKEKDSEDETYIEKTLPLTFEEFKKLELCYIKALLNTFQEIKKPERD